MPLSHENRTRFAQALRACVAQRWPNRTRAWLLRELSRSCECSDTSISNLLSGKSNPSYPMVLRLANALDVPLAIVVPVDVQWQLHGNPRPCAPRAQAAPAPPPLPDTEGRVSDPGQRRPPTNANFTTLRKSMASRQQLFPAYGGPASPFAPSKEPEITFAVLTRKSAQE